MLNNNTIEVYDFSLATEQAGYEQRLELLSPDEVERAERFKFNHHRMCWVSSRAALRSILAAHLEVQPHDLTFTLRDNGKPQLQSTSSARSKKPDAGKTKNDRLHFNLSHSHERGLIALSKNLEVGCDVEHVKPITDWAAITRRFFSQVEQQELFAVDLSLRPLAFFLGWTRKEAIIKATGEGLRAKLDAFDVTLTPEEEALVLEYRDESQVDANWHLRHFDPHPNYVAAVAVDSQVEPEFVFHQDCTPGE
ncbi:MAG: 4'-phosphopantetheinyl transferase superfamily protein [Gammaproteobacteria bacterium]